MKHIFIIVVMFLIGIGLTFITFTNDPYQPWTPQFNEGQIVTVKISGDKGMIIRVRPRNGGCRYTVRIKASQSYTDARWGADGPITNKPLATLNCMREYELEAIN